MELSNYVEYESKKKSYGAAYLLWIFLGWCGVHRWYTDDNGLAIAWIIATILTFLDPFTFFKFYIAFVIVEWVAIGLRVKAINDSSLLDLKRTLN